MTIDVALIIATIILFLTTSFFIILRIFQKRWYKSIIIIGIFFAGAICYFPLNTGIDLFPQIVASILDSVKLFVLETSYLETLDTAIVLSGGNAPFAQAIFGVLFLIAPVCTIIFIIAIVSDALIYFGLRLPTTQKKYIFSCLNEKTFSLAKSIKIHDRFALFIFCNVLKSKREGNPYFHLAKQNNFVVIERSIMNIAPSWNKDSTYFVISENSSENLDYALDLLTKYHQNPHAHIVVTSNEVEDEALIDRKIALLGEGKCTIRHINETQLMAYDVLHEQPLFNVVSDNWKKVSMLVVGGGYVGLEVLKNSIWCSRSTKYIFDATVIDYNIERSEGIFNKLCPALDKKEYNVFFYPNNIDAETDKLMDFVRNNNGKFNYIVISTNNDEINIKSALDLRSFYLRKGYRATIAVSVRDHQKYDLISHEKNTLEDSFVKMFAFGSTVSLYDYETIMNNIIEKRAKCINSVYVRTSKRIQGVEDDIITSQSVIDDWRGLNMQKRRSNMALAVFLDYILWMCGYKTTIKDTTESFTLSEGESEKLAELEHTRWNAYQLIEGYYPWDESSYLMSPESRSGTAQNTGRRLHACITDWNSINRLDKKLGTHYSAYDREFITAIPDILSGFNGKLGYCNNLEKISNDSEETRNL